MKEHMKYVIGHAEEFDKVLKVNAQVTELKSIMLMNIDKVITCLCPIPCICSNLMACCAGFWNYLEGWYLHVIFGQGGLDVQLGCSLFMLCPLSCIILACLLKFHHLIVSCITAKPSNRSCGLCYLCTFQVLVRGEHMVEIEAKAADLRDQVI